MSARRERGPARSVLIDSGAFFALAVQRDANHQEARRILRRLQELRFRLFTTNFVVAEAHALLLNRESRAVAAAFLADIRSSAATTIVRASAADEDRAAEIIASYQDKAFSFTDALSFAVMERLGLQYAFAFDRHFRQYGQTILEFGAPPLV